jgi:hypothetical protein
LSVAVEWYDANQTIIIAQVNSNWTWATARQSRMTVQQLAQSVSQSVALVVLLPQDLSVPPDGFAENSNDALQRHAAAGLKRVIYVTTNAATRALWQSVIDMYASPAVQYGFAPSLNAAVSLLS